MEHTKCLGRDEETGRRAAPAEGKDVWGSVQTGFVKVDETARRSKRNGDAEREQPRTDDAEDAVCVPSRVVVRGQLGRFGSKLLGVVGVVDARGPFANLCSDLC